jgi:hypothetical protein
MQHIQRKFIKAARSWPNQSFHTPRHESRLIPAMCAQLCVQHTYENCPSSRAPITINEGVPLGRLWEKLGVVIEGGIHTATR